MPVGNLMLEGDWLCVRHHSSGFDPDRIDLERLPCRFHLAVESPTSPPHLMLIRIFFPVRHGEAR